MTSVSSPAPSSLDFSSSFFSSLSSDDVEEAEYVAFAVEKQNAALQNSSAAFVASNNTPNTTDDSMTSMAVAYNDTEDPQLVDNDTFNCFEFCRSNSCSLEALQSCVYAYIQPSPVEWLFIGLHLVVFSVGVLGNFLVCFVVLRSRDMQSVTNLFIVNLAVADFIVLIICSPPSVLQTVTETWFLGEVMCKIVHLIQNQSIAVSVQTLCAIAVERYFAICRPLKSRITRKKVTFTVLAIWTVGTIVALPNLIYQKQNNTFQSEEISHLLTYCELTIDVKSQGAYHLIMIVAIYLVPMLTIGVFYAIISHHLWHVKMPGVTVRSSSHEYCGEYRSHTETQLNSRKKVAKMLIAIVLIFAACYLPINVIFALRSTKNLEHMVTSEGLPYLFSAAHWLVYFNSAFNPVVYNFMSVKFKKEFRSVFRCVRAERSLLLHESTYGHGKLRAQQRTPITQSTEVDNNGAQHV